MRKLIFTFLFTTLCLNNLPAQNVDSNYELDSLDVNYVIVSRDINQTGTDGNTYTTTYYDSAATYEVVIGWPDADTSLFDF